MSSIKSARWRNWHRTGSARGSDRECIYSYVSLYFSAYYGIKPRKKKGLRLWHQQRGFPNDRQFAACNTHISGLAQYARSYTLLRNVHSMWSDKKTWSSVGLGRAWIVFWDDKISLKLAWERTFEALKMMFVIERHNHAQTGIQTSVFFILPMYMCFFTSLWLFSNRIVRPFGRGGHFRFRAAVNYFFFFWFRSTKTAGRAWVGATIFDYDSYKVAYSAHAWAYILSSIFLYYVVSLNLWSRISCPYHM